MQDPIIVPQSRRWERPSWFAPVVLSVVLHGALLIAFALALARAEIPTAPEIPPGETGRALACGLACEDPRQDQLVTYRPQIRDYPAAMVIPDNPPSASAGSGSSAQSPPAASDVVRHSPGSGASGAAGVHADWLRVPGRPRSIVYLIDCSLSMAENRAFESARAEVVQSLAEVDDQCLVDVIVYDEFPRPLLARTSSALMKLTPAVREELGRALAREQPRDGTSHLNAIQAALRLYPDIIFLVTDEVAADEDLTTSDVHRLRQMNRTNAAIHVVELVSTVQGSGHQGGLRQLAQQSGGTYRTVRLTH